MKLLERFYWQIFSQKIRLLSQQIEIFGNYTERQITISVLHDNGKITERFIPSETITNTFILYPNGADEIINIKGPLSPSGSNYSIYDMFGVNKMHGIIKNNQINVKTLPQGLYVLGFETDHGYCYKKFIKK